MGRLKRMWDRLRGKGPKPGDVIDVSNEALERMLGRAWTGGGGKISDTKKRLTPKERRRRKARRQMARESRRRNRT